MILDEATANIDSETESLIQTSLEKMMQLSTMLVGRAQAFNQSNTQIISLSCNKAKLRNKANTKPCLNKKAFTISYINYNMNTKMLKSRYLTTFLYGKKVLMGYTI